MYNLYFENGNTCLNCEIHNRNRGYLGIHIRSQSTQPQQRFLTIHILSITNSHEVYGDDCTKANLFSELNSDQNLIFSIDSAPFCCQISERNVIIIQIWFTNNLTRFRDRYLFLCTLRRNMDHLALKLYT